MKYYEINYFYIPIFHISYIAIIKYEEIVVTRTKIVLRRLGNHVYQIYLQDF